MYVPEGTDGDGGIHDVAMPSLREHLQAMRHRRGMTQQGLADVTGRGVSYIRKVESGDIARPGADALDEIAVALALDTGERRHLFELGGVDLVDELPDVEVLRATLTGRQLAELVEHEPDAAAYFDARCNVLAHNESFASTFTHIDEFANIAEWFFASSSARSVLVEWEREALHKVAWVRGLVGRYRDAAWAQWLLERLAEFAEFQAMWCGDDQVSFGRGPDDSRIVMADPITGERFLLRVVQHPVTTSHARVMKFVGVREEMPGQDFDL